MSGDDISTGAKIGITLCILVFLIAIVFSLLTVVRNITNSEAGKMQNGLDQMSASQFQDYDQKYVTGTQLLSAISIFEGQNVAIVVRTATCQTTDANKYQAFNYGLLLQGFKVVEDTTYPKVKIGTTYAFGAGTLKKPTGAGYYEVNPYTDDTGSVKYNLNYKPCNAPGIGTYIKGSSKFFAELIKDKTGNIDGIFFTQEVTE